jgi:hypothetical protein
MSKDLAALEAFDRVHRQGHGGRRPDDQKQNLDAGEALLLDLLYLGAIVGGEPLDLFDIGRADDNHRFTLFAAGVANG